jgi:hypothetical protein
LLLNSLEASVEELRGCGLLLSWTWFLSNPKK